MRHEHQDWLVDKGYANITVAGGHQPLLETLSHSAEDERQGRLRINLTSCISALVRCRRLVDSQP